MSTILIEQVLDEIISSVHLTFGVKVIDTRVITKGWLNIKWRFLTETGSIFVKFYHPNRYKLHLPDRRWNMEKTLFLQQRLHESGVACPSVYKWKGQMIQETKSGYLFVMMDWVQGSLAEAGQMSTTQMNDLGEITGRMHQLLSEEELDSSSWTPDQSVCLSDLNKNLEHAKIEQSIRIISLLEQAIGNVQSLDFEVFNESPQGWTHWDLWTDNVLMDEHGVVGIVDFDRMAVAYPEIDVARALLSGAFDGKGIRKDAVQAFLAGYREYRQVPNGLILRSIKMLYLIESTWWLRTEVLQDTTVPKRFMEEMIWLTEKWDELPDIFSES